MPASWAPQADAPILRGAASPASCAAYGARNPCCQRPLEEDTLMEVLIAKLLSVMLLGIDISSRTYLRTCRKRERRWRCGDGRSAYCRLQVIPSGLSHAVSRACCCPTIEFIRSCVKTAASQAASRPAELWGICWGDPLCGIEPHMPRTAGNALQRGALP